MLRLSYKPALGRVLDVYHLTEWLGEYVNGHASGTRSMEEMIRELVIRAAAEVGVEVDGQANLVIDAGGDQTQRMTVTYRAAP